MNSKIREVCYIGLIAEVFYIFSYLCNDIQSHGLEGVLDHDCWVVLGDSLQVVYHVVHSSTDQLQHALDLPRGEGGAQPLPQIPPLRSIYFTKITKLFLSLFSVM